MATIHVLHENDAWTAPLELALQHQGLPYQMWHLAHGILDLAQEAPDGVFYSRMSASSHTRGHRYAPELTGAVLAWLERSGRRVLNGTQALRLELRKVAQYEALRQHGILSPRTVAAVGRENILAAAESFAGRRFITKHNRAGKGLGVRLFENADDLRHHLDSAEFEPSVDGITLVQEYIEAPEPFITRVEFIGGAFLYAVRVDTSEGFELCPADVCATDSLTPKFQIIDGFEHELLPRYQQFLNANGVDVGALEFIVSKDGTAYTYDVNTNTNYNPEAEEVAGISGMPALARFLGEELAAIASG